MTASLAGKVAIVTGGASGLGRGIVERFVDAGAEVPIFASSVAGFSAEAVDKSVEKTRIKMRNDRPLPRDGTPEDVAEAALYFAAFTSATGTVLTVDGGTSVGSS